MTPTESTTPVLRLSNAKRTAIHHDEMRTLMIDCYNTLRQMADIPAHNMRAIGVAIIKLEQALDLVGGTSLE